MHELIIIGAGPAGMTAAIYAAKNKLQTLIFAKELPSSNSHEGSFLVNFKELKKEFESQLKANKELLQFKVNSEVIALEKNVVSFSVEEKLGRIFYARAVIIATDNGKTEFDLLTIKDNSGKIKVNSQMQTNIPGIFAAGACCSASLTDLFVSSGEGAKAALSALNFIKNK